MKHTQIAHCPPNSFCICGNVRKYYSKTFLIFLFATFFSRSSSLNFANVRKLFLLDWFQKYTFFRANTYHGSVKKIDSLIVTLLFAVFLQHKLLNHQIRFWNETNYLLKIQFCIPLHFVFLWQMTIVLRWKF